MDYSVDVVNEYQKIKSKFLSYSLLFASIFTAVLIGDALLVILSGENYLICLIIAIVISILFSWFAIFFFSNIYNDINSRYRYFKGYDSGVKSIEEIEIIGKCDGLTYVNGLYVYPIQIRSFSGLEAKDKIIFTFADNLNYEIGDKLTITTYQRILINAEKHS